MVHLSILEKKWSYFFSLMDVNDDGILEPKDFDHIIERLKESDRITITKRQENYYRLTSRKLFDGLLRESSVRGERKLTLGQWLHMMHVNVEKQKSSTFIRSLKVNLCRYLFEIFDEDKNGYIDYDEFKEIFRIYGIDEKHSYVAFIRLDLNQDNLLSRYEIYQALDTFFYSNSTDDRNYVFGMFNSVMPSYISNILS